MPGGSAAPSKPDEFVVEDDDGLETELSELCEEELPHPALVARSVMASVASTQRSERSGGVAGTL